MGWVGWIAEHAGSRGPAAPCAPPAAALPSTPPPKPNRPSTLNPPLTPKGVTRHTRPEFIYFWFYFVIINGVWIVIPTACLVWAIKRINAAVAG
jgi:hypothetical protein